MSYPDRFFCMEPTHTLTTQQVKRYMRRFLTLSPFFCKCERIHTMRGKKIPTKYFLYHFMFLNSRLVNIWRWQKNDCRLPELKRKSCCCPSKRTEWHSHKCLTCFMSPPPPWQSHIADLRPPSCSNQQEKAPGYFVLRCLATNAASPSSLPRRWCLKNQVQCLSDFCVRH